MIRSKDARKFGLPDSLMRFMVIGPGMGSRIKAAAE